MHNRQKTIQIIPIFSGGADITTVLIGSLYGICWLLLHNTFAKAIKLPTYSVLSGTTYTGLAWYSYINKKQLITADDLKCRNRLAHLVGKLNITKYFRPIIEPSLIKRLRGVLIFNAAAFAKEVQQLYSIASYPKTYAVATYSTGKRKVVDATNEFSASRIDHIVWSSINLPAIVPYCKTPNNCYFDAAVEMKTAPDIAKGKVSADIWRNSLKVFLILQEELTFDGVYSILKTFHRKAFRYFIDLLAQDKQLAQLVKRFLRANKPLATDKSDIDLLIKFKVTGRYAKFILPAELKAQLVTKGIVSMQYNKYLQALLQLAADDLDKFRSLPLSKRTVVLTV